MKTKVKTVERFAIELRVDSTEVMAVDIAMVTYLRGTPVTARPLSRADWKKYEKKIIKAIRERYFG